MQGLGLVLMVFGISYITTILIGIVVWIKLLKCLDNDDWTSRV